MLQSRLLWTILAILLAALTLWQTWAGEAREEQLWQAAREGNVAEIRRLLEAGVPVDAATQFDCTALYFAVNANRPEAMKVLIEAGADVNVRDSSYGYTAMGMAASSVQRSFPIATADFASQFHALGSSRLVRS